MTNRGRRRRGVERSQGKPTTSLGPNPIYVSIFCDDLSHRGEIVPMRTFVPFRLADDGENPSIEWHELGGRYKTRDSDVLLNVARRATQWIDAENNKMTAQAAGQHPELVSRARIKLVCERHSAPALAENLAALDTVFSTLWRNGFEEISFSFFIEFVRRVKSCELRA